MNLPTLDRSLLPLPSGALAALAWCALDQPSSRAEIVAAQHECLRAAFRQAFAGSDLPLFTLRDLRITHTPLGQPRPLRSGPLAAWGRQAGVRAEDLHVSFSHDGARLAALLAWLPGIRGLGIDLVHLPRLATPGKDRDYLHRFARRAMATDEYAAFAEAAACDEADELRRRVAAAFALKEAASKALGTGLLLGLGLGNAQSVALPTLRVTWGQRGPQVEADGAAACALRRIRARRLVSMVRVDGPFIVAEVAALR